MVAKSGMVSVIGAAVGAVDGVAPVAVVLANLADGVSAEEILRSYPSLTPPAVQAALAYAADLAQERVLSLPA